MEGWKIEKDGKYEGLENWEGLEIREEI